MLSHEREKLVRSLHTKKGRETTGLCLVEGQKIIDVAGDAIEFKFTPDMTDKFEKLVTTETPQDIAAVAKIPSWSLEDITKKVWAQKITRTAIVIIGDVIQPKSYEYSKLYDKSFSHGYRKAKKI